MGFSVHIVKVNGVHSCLVSTVLQNIFCCVSQKKESHDKWLHYRWTVSLTFIWQTYDSRGRHFTETPDRRAVCNHFLMIFHRLYVCLCVLWPWVCRSAALRRWVRAAVASGSGFSPVCWQEPSAVEGQMGSEGSWPLSGSPAERYPACPSEARSTPAPDPHTPLMPAETDRDCQCERSLLYLIFFCDFMFSPKGNISIFCLV